MADDGAASPEQRLAVIELTRQALACLQDGTITVSGGSLSMFPLFSGGERLHWRRPRGRVRVGAVLIFVQNPGPVVHRVIGRTRGGLRTKGDGRPGPDRDPVRPDDVLGVVESFEKSGQRFDLTGTRPRVFTLVTVSCSLVGWGVHAVAAAADAVLCRTVPRWGDRRLFRAPAWFLQRQAQRLLHGLLFRPCHPVRSHR